MKSVFCMAFGLIFSVSLYVTNAADPAPLQNFCVGVNDVKSSVFVNGKFCKNPKDVTINDFIYKGFDVPSDTNTTLGGVALLLNDRLFPAVNTLGVSMARVDFGPFGLNTPHMHPQASEVFAVMEGTLYAGFVATDNKLYDTVITKGDIIVFPQALIHFQLNLGKTNAFAIAAFGSQNPGRFDIATALFGTTPPIFSDVLTKAFQADDRVVQLLQAPFVNSTSVEFGRSLLKLLTEAT